MKHQNVEPLRSGLCTTLLTGLLIILLSACGATSETDLGTAGFGGVPLVTDSEPLAQGLDAAGLEVILTEPEDLLEVHQEVQGGLVSYTPLPPEIEPIPWDPEIWPIPWCDPRNCDPIDPFIGWQFSGAYITPKFAETLVRYGIDPYQAVRLDGLQLSTNLAELRTEIYVIERICDGLTGECKTFKIPVKLDPEDDVPCPICNAAGSNQGEFVRDISEADLIITSNTGLAQIEAELGNLIQLQGDGVAPVIQGVNVAVHPEVGKEVGTALAETLLSEEVQVSLYKHAGVLPVGSELLEEVMTGPFGEHVKGALEHGTFSADSLPGSFGVARPTPIPVN